MPKLLTSLIFLLQYHKRFLRVKVYTDKKVLTPCSRKAGERSREAFSSISVPDYSPLLSPAFWLTWNTLKIVAKE